MEERNLSPLVHELYPQKQEELKNLAKESRKIKIIAGLTSLSTSIAGGIIETDFISPVYNTAAGEYQFLISIALPLIAYGASKLACYVYRKLTHSKARLRGKDMLQIVPGVYTGFDTAAALRGLSKGHEIGYLGKVNKEVIFKSPVSDVMLSEAKVGGIGLPISIAHLIGFGSIACYFADSIKPIKHLSIGSLLALFSGIPYLAATPAICDATIELSEYTIERIKAKAERFAMLRKIQLS